MAGRGFAPKDPEKRARRNADPIGLTTLEFRPSEQPDLPQLTKYDADLDSHVVIPWHPQTEAWWSTWRDAAQSDSFPETDWFYLVDTALIHHQFWSGDIKAAAELRLRVAKFGVTPEDRARLRMVFADADAKDQSRGVSSPSAPGGAYGGLRAVQG